MDSSPAQIAFGKNSSLPSIKNERLPALETLNITRDPALNIASLHSARQAFFGCESSKKIERALKISICSSGEYYNINKKVYYKRQKSEKSATVLFLHHGTKFAKVHICRIKSAETKDQTEFVNLSIQPNFFTVPFCNSSHSYKSNSSVPQNNENSDEKPERENSVKIQ